MSIAQYRLNWDSYKSNVCNGFTNLQQKEEFVDMTLAADGHLVKVHKSIFALASPYIKSMLQSTPNDHPVIFLGSVSHEILNYILSYVYTGEVSVEVDKIQSFMSVAKDLRLSGLFGMPTPKVGSKENTVNFRTDLKEKRYSEDNSIADTGNPVEEIVTDNTMLIDSVNNIEVLDTTVSNVENDVSTKHKTSSGIHIHDEPGSMANEEFLNNRDSGLYMTADGYQYKLEIQQTYNKHQDSAPIVVPEAYDKSSDLVQAADVNTPIASVNYNNDNFDSFEDEYKKKISAASLKLDTLNPEAITLQYTMSNRGSLQLILNRYMYYCHHQSHGGRRRRWRCIEYRSKHCPAFIDTDNEIMTSRKFGHTHSFHDEKIRIKMKRDLIFTNLNILLQKLSEKNKRNDVAT